MNSEGQIVSVSGGAAEIPKSVTAANVQGYIQNIHLAKQYQNLVVQVFPGYPQVWVEDVNGEMDNEQSEILKEFAKKLKIYPSMQISFFDTIFYGASVKSVGYKNINGIYTPSEIRNLPPQSFNQSSGFGNSVTINQLLPGIIVKDNGDVEVWQTDDAGRQTKIENFYIIKEPTTPEPSGRAYALPCYPVIATIDFTNRAINQQVARVGAPSLFPQIADGIVKEEDYKRLENFARDFQKRWGKDTGFILPPGISFPDVKIKEGSTAQDRLDDLIEWLDVFFNPTTVLQKSTGTSIGGSDSGAAEIWANFIGGTQSWIEEAYEALLQPYLDVNGYEGLYVKIRLKRPDINRSEERRLQVVAAVASKAITVEEVRDNLTELNLKEWTPEIEAQITDTYANTVTSNPFGNVGEVRGEDKIVEDTEKALIKTDDEILSDLVKKLLS